MRKTTFLFLVILIPVSLFAQHKRPLLFTVDGILLHSTHLNNFPGLSAGVLKSAGKHWQIGGGIEYSWSPAHDDNGWTLTSLRFLPVYGDARWLPLAHHLVDPYFRVSLGFSFNSYMKVDEFGNGPYPVHEGGLFTYGGLGASVHLSDKVSLLAETGAKGFRMSFDNMDVNPHGLTLRAGIIISN